jgi:tetratricopeptide (TPR) repeat protein
MTKIFLSYAREDRDRVEEIYYKLSKCNFNCRYYNRSSKNRTKVAEALNQKARALASLGLFESAISEYQQAALSPDLASNQDPDHDHFDRAIQIEWGAIQLCQSTIQEKGCN